MAGCLGNEMGVIETARIQQELSTGCRQRIELEIEVDFQREST